ncbi:hypothetical protein [Corallococcus carmarthensis]|uniref:hypothetical protein n=1 Tax=Corallococcus carmarthensis TaxID=2316728 RepID=UPI00148C4806|nr:hypothetical protein [Corallococcus carmarthensis]NOK22269.1 hypothetical protein [Corallococcus carmarthensis]
MYEIAATVLLGVLAADNGPYVLITWSSKSNQHNELMAHFASEVPELPTPAMSSYLPKEKFVIAGTTTGEAASPDHAPSPERPKASHQSSNTTDGGSSSLPSKIASPAQDELQSSRASAVASGEGVGGGPSLQEEIKRTLDAHPQLAALMMWERAARRASGDVVNSLLELFTRDDRFKGNCGPELEKVLTHMAGAAVGKDNVKDDRRAAISEALTPILFDRLMHLPPPPNEVALWSRAISLGTKTETTGTTYGAKLNALSLVAFPGQEPTKAGDRGSVFQPAEGAEKYFIQRTGISRVALMHEFLEKSVDGKTVAPLETDFSDEFRWTFIGTRATCDQAQSRGMMCPAILALEVPETLLYGKKHGLRIKDHGAALLTPSFSCPNKDGLLKNKRLVLNWHWVASFGPKELDGASVLYRLREPLINQISSTKSGYQARPGIVSFTPENG